MKNSSLKFVTISLVLFSVLFFASSVQAQVFKIGVKAGLSAKISDGPIAGRNTTPDGQGNINEQLQSAGFGVHGGIFTRFTLGPILIQPEMTVSTLKDLDIPLLIGFEVSKFRFLVGPMARMQFDRNVDLTEVDNQEEYLSFFDSTNFGFQAGAGVDIGKISIDVRYEGNLSKLGDGINLFGGQRGFDSGPSQLVASVGYRF